MADTDTARPASPRDPFGLRLARAAARVRVDLPLVALDVFVAAASYTLVLVARFEGEVPTAWWKQFAIFAPIACATHLVSTCVCGGYGRWWRHASIEEARRLVLAGLVSGTLLLAVFSWGPQRMPLSLLVAGPLLTTAIQGGVRFQSRLFAFNHNRVASGGLRVAVVGAGKTGAAVLREMQNSRLGFVAVAVVDDDPALHRRSLHGVPIVGGIEKLADLVRDSDIHLALLAIQSGDPAIARRVADATNGSGVPIRVVREPGFWVHGAPLQQMRALGIEDLLGRSQVEIDVEPVRSLLRGRRVLVTGGGGWIGAEIARQVAEFDPAALALLDHDETHLHDTVRDLPDARLLLADVRELDAVTKAFEEFRPEVVFHAAAHKHVPILEEHVCEAVRTNVLGTANTVDAAVKAGTEHFICISTDKAAQPTISIMGASKWLAEQIVLARAPAGAVYHAVRFGNVLGSRGSVIPTFQHQIDTGGPVTVTDPRMTRFFMSVNEAVRFVLLAAALGVGHSLLALNMGEQVNIYELAERMIRLAGYRAGHDIEIQIVGSRPGDNFEGAIVGPAEGGSPLHDQSLVSISPVRLPVRELDFTLERLTALALAGDDGGARSVLHSVATPPRCTPGLRSVGV
ncbi:MAG TPA: nucleoside-diphosphate sugar epimerase/dehydratase [Acidimicrobiia bacterium]|nr:nucleoside-diphosphate sugar epimerase/dehydratase [Acidimicrobiia bacterium]